MAKKKALLPTFRFLDSSAYTRMKWKNGLGETKEIAVDSEQPFRWRVSSARVSAPGPFSLFPGYDRKLVFLSGDTNRLKIAGEAERELVPLEVTAFAGEKQVTAEVSGPCDDLNLFTMRGKARGSLHVACFKAKEKIQFPYQGDEHFVFLIQGEIEYFDPGTRSEGKLSAGQTLWITVPPGVNLLNLCAQANAESALAAWITITYAQPSSGDR